MAGKPGSWKASEENIHRPLVPPLRGFARGTENTEIFNLSIAVERTAMESHSIPETRSGTEGGNAS
jgi:hypothetical protein